MGMRASASLYEHQKDKTELFSFQKTTLKTFGQNQDYFMERKEDVALRHVNSVIVQSETSPKFVTQVS